MSSLTQFTRLELEVERAITEEAISEVRSIVTKLNWLVQITDPNDPANSRDNEHLSAANAVHTAPYLPIVMPIRGDAKSLRQHMDDLQSHLYNRVLEINRELRLRQLSVEGEFIK